MYSNDKRADRSAMMGTLEHESKGSNAFLVAPTNRDTSLPPHEAVRCGRTRRDAPARAG